ncbi:MAG: NAD(P)-dependent oxidoreductase [Candidatus Micrarchaeota archaeon]
MAGTRTRERIQSPISVGIYHAPGPVRDKLRSALLKSGYDVSCEVPCGVPLDPTNAALNADAWLTKWTFGLNGRTLRELHPRSALVTMSVGTDHIDLAAAKSVGLDVFNCPTYCSVSVAEHALALGFRAIYGPTKLPSFASQTVIFDHFSDGFAESAVAQILMRSRQMEESITRAKEYDYERGDAPWRNHQLTGSTVAIIGHDRKVSNLARILRLGFQCNLVGFDFDRNLEAFGVLSRPLELVSHCNYIFNCSGEVDIEGTRIDSRSLPKPEKEFTGSNVLVLGAGGIGSIIARISKLGFDCSTASLSRTEKNPLSAIGVRYTSRIEPPLVDSDFIFICLPLNEDTVGILSQTRFAVIGRRPVIVNVTRDEIVDNQALYIALQDGLVRAYGTDVLPDDKVLWARGNPKELTTRFLGLGNVVATPHEADCSRQSLHKLVSEVEQRLTRLNR